MNSLPSLFEHFSRILIISLPERKDRRKEMLDQLEGVGLADDPRVTFFDAVRPADRGRFGSVGAHGCFESHLRILKSNQGARLLILEDDCDFSSEARTYRLPQDFEVFYGGYLEASNPEDPGNGNIIGSHCMGFSARGAELAADYLEGLLSNRVEHDAKAVAEPTYDPNILPPIDGAYVWFRRAHPELKTVFAQPQIAHQRPSRSDIGDLRFYDRIPGLRNAAALARRLKRRLATP